MVLLKVYHFLLGLLVNGNSFLYYLVCTGFAQQVKCHVVTTSSGSSSKNLRWVFIPAQ